jgi:hypothetical protein
VSRVLICWELGAGYGHLTSVRNLASALQERGHEVLLALRDLSHAENVLGQHQFRIFQAPLWLPPPLGLTPPGNYSELLRGFGYLNEAGLSGIVRSWRSLFDLVEPDMIVTESSPTALLASRGYRTPRAMLGTGYGCPPPCTPMPALMWWQPNAAQRYEESERLLLATINAVLRRFSAPQLTTIADLLRVEETFLRTFAEIDHYPSRDAAQKYWGPAFDVTTGEDPTWPMASGVKVFAYLDPGHPSFAPVVRTLRDCGHAVLVHAPRVSEQVRREFDCATLTIAAGAVKLERVLAEAALIVCNAGHGTVSAALLAGRPLLLVPKFLEQEMLARRVEQLGAGRILRPGQAIGQWPQILNDLLTDRRYASAASTFARAHANFDRAAQTGAICTRIEEIIAARAD